MWEARLAYITWDWVSIQAAPNGCPPRIPPRDSPPMGVAPDEGCCGHGLRQHRAGVALDKGCTCNRWELHRTNFCIGPDKSPSGQGSGSHQMGVTLDEVAPRVTLEGVFTRNPTRGYIGGCPEVAPTCFGQPIPIIIPLYLWSTFWWERRSTAQVAESDIPEVDRRFFNSKCHVP